MKILISSETPQDALEALRNLGYEVLLLPPCSRIAAPVASHADMLVYKNESGTLICESRYYEENRLLFDSIGCNIIASDKVLAPCYPSDIAFNALRLCGKLFCHVTAVASEVSSGCSELVPVKQGYARCSCCVTADGCAITADPSLAAAFDRCGIPHLVISPNGIMLPGYGYGFIGGASGLLPDGRNVLFGKLESHPDGADIADFLRIHGGYTELMSGKLYDVGSFIVI